jgi:hypothetical protein
MFCRDLNRALDPAARLTGLVTGASPPAGTRNCNIRADGPTTTAH